MTAAATARLLFLADTTGGAGSCWPWHGAIAKVGYGRIGVRYAHRAVYEASIGPIPPDLDLDHLCRNRLCVNPSHLEPVTRAENVRRQNRSLAADRTRCRNGHLLPAYENQPRHCRSCERKRHTEYMRGYRARFAA